MSASSEAITLQVGEGQTSNFAGRLFTDGSRVGGVWMPLLLAVGDSDAAPEKECATIKPGCAVTMPALCGFMVPKYAPEVGHANRVTELVREVRGGGEIGIGVQKTAAMRVGTVLKVVGKTGHTQQRARRLHRL